MIWRAFEWGSQVVSQQISVLKRLFQHHLAPKDEPCNYEVTLLQTRHIQYSHAHARAPSPPPVAHHSSPHISRIDHKPQNRVGILKDPRRLRQCNIESIPRSSQHGTARRHHTRRKPCTCMRPRGPQPTTCTLATRRDAHRSERPAFPLCTVPCHSPELSSTGARACRCSQTRFGLDPGARHLALLSGGRFRGWVVGLLPGINLFDRDM